MLTFNLRILLLLLGFLTTSRAFATDFLAIQRSDCKTDWGIVVGLDREQMHFLNFDGQLLSYDRANIQRMYRFRSLELPFKAFFPKGFEAHLREVETQLRSKFVGYAYEFKENSVFLLDKEGRTLVVELNDIRAIRPAPTQLAFTKIPQRKARFLLPAADSCPAVPYGEGNEAASLPEQIYDSPLKIQSKLEELEDGYRSMDGLQERINFYPRPVMFEKATRIGFFLDSGVKEELPLKIQPVNAYLQTGSGASYKFQSQTIFGGHRFQFLPFSSPVFGLESQFKSHLIHGNLTANLGALKAGDHVYSQAFKDAGQTNLWFASSLNHQKRSCRCMESKTKSSPTPPALGRSILGLRSMVARKSGSENQPLNSRKERRTSWSISLALRDKRLRCGA